jgi:hypothetical protein
VNGPLTERPALYLLEAFGIGNPWIVYRIAHGALEDDGRMTEAIAEEDVRELDLMSRQIALRLGVYDPIDPERPTRHIDRRGLCAGTGARRG